jgi:hypothetical protein
VNEVLRDHPTEHLQRTAVLASWTKENDAPHSPELQLLYLAMFLSAEAALVTMAMREYANDVRGITEYDWMYGPQDGSDRGLPNRDAVR